MMKTRILALLLGMLLMLSCVFLPACTTADDNADQTPSDPPASNDGGKDDGKDDAPPAEPDDDDPPAKPTSKLYGKTVIWNGDSICQGTSAYGAWADRLDYINDLKAWKNYGVGGGTITENVLYQSGKVRHSVSATLEQMHQEFPDADYVILEGGTNDADLLGRITEGDIPERFGSVSPTDFSGNYDRETYCGALESTFYRAKQLWPEAKICFIVAQKMGTNYFTSENRYAYFQAAMDICEKWEIPYLNLWDDCELDPNEEEMYDPKLSAEENEECSMYRDGQHLTHTGYDLTTELIDAFLKSL